jgi:phage regulator Rha-like protein
MNALVNINGVSRTMSSREIAELTGKRHDQVLRTARDLVQQGITQSVECLYQAVENGREYPEHHLNKRDSLVLVARLSPEFTGRVVDRWLELEAAQTPALPRTFAEALATHCRGVTKRYPSSTHPNFWVSTKTVRVAV